MGGKRGCCQPWASLAIAFGLSTQPSSFTHFAYNTAAYTYLANSPLVSQISFKSNSVTRMTTTKSYDFLNRLSSISSAPSASSAFSFSYAYNSANQRTRATLADGSYWLYEYDSLGQVRSGKKYWYDGTPVAGQQFEYGFDDIGNRDWTGGRASGQSDYNVNSANQYTSRTVAGVVDVLGIANPTANVTVNGNVANRRGEYFHWPLTVTNSSAAQYPTITVTSQYGATQSDSGEVFVPYATESYGYDFDGNLTSDGRWTYIWDGENRLIEMKRDTSLPTLSSRLRLVFEYDHQGRRIRKTFYTHNDSGWVEDTDTVFLYDGWNLMGELNANSSNAKVRTYVWGLDLSGSEQGAGGVGGLLKVTDYTSGTTHHFVGYDGNGNVVALFDGTTGAATARYEYGPFGEPLRATGSITGSMAKKNPFRFSTKLTDNESGLVYYGYRFYSAQTGRWLNRDPIGQEGGINLFGLARNEPVTDFDSLGLKTYDFKRKTYLREINFQPGDEVIHPDVSLTVGPKVLSPFQEGSGFAKLQCVLANLGFNLPPPPWPMFLADFNGTGMGWTLEYGFPSKQATFFHRIAFGSITKHNAAQRAVTLWHEIKGHQIDDAEDGTAFNTKYEAPIQQAIDKLRADKIYKDNRCAECFTSDGTSWFMEDSFDRILCECDIPKPRR